MAWHISNSSDTKVIVYDSNRVGSNPAGGIFLVSQENDERDIATSSHEGGVGSVFLDQILGALLVP